MEEADGKREGDGDGSGLETLLTRLEVTPRGELFAGFRGLGGIHYPNWKHLFVTHILGRNIEGEAEESLRRYREVCDKIDANPKLCGLENRLKSKYWTVLQLLCPITLKDELPTEFIRGHYTQQARWRLTNPGNLVRIDELTLNGLKDAREIKNSLDGLRAEIGKIRNPAYATRTFNDLDELFDSHGANFEEIMRRKGEIASLRNLPAEIFEMKAEIYNRMTSLNGSLNGKLRLKYKQFGSDRVRELRVEQDSWDYLERGRMITAGELLARRWLFIDTEIPHFRRDNPRITWAGLYVCEGESETREIHTIHDLGVEDVDGFRICRYKNQDEMDIGIAERINQINPDVVSSYNTRFDLIKPTESESGFPIGDERTDPIYKVTTKFFERIGVKDRFVIDFLRWQKIARAFDINAKLEMAAGFKKEINYDEMEALEDLAQSGDERGRESTRKIAGYLGGDVKELVKLFKSAEFRKDLEDACWICGNFGLGIERVLHSANCVNDVQEKGYFKELGIYREEVPPHQRTKIMQELRTAARERFTRHSSVRLIEQEGKQGLFIDVSKVYIPVGDIIKSLVARRFPEVMKFDAYKAQFRADKKRLFFLEQYQREFGRWLIEDYGAYVKDVSAFDESLKNIGHEEFEDVYHRFRESLESQFPRELSKLNMARLTADAVEHYVLPELKEFLRKHALNYRYFQKMANQRSMIKRRGRNLIGNYDVFPDRRFFVPEKRRLEEDIAVMDDFLEERIGEINKFFRENSLDLIAQDGNYIYLTGSRELLEKEDCPVILVDTIPRLYNADHPYYEKFGFFSHMKLKDEPGYHLNILESSTYGKMLQCLLEGKNSEARQVYLLAINKLSSGNIKMNELMFFNKNKERYSAFVEGNDDKMHFSLKCPDGRSFESDKRGQYFIDDRGEEEERVYIANPCDFAPDIRKYSKRLEKRARLILEPVGGLSAGRQMSLIGQPL